MLREELEALRATLDHLVSELKSGLLAGRFAAEPIPLFKLRIALAETAASAVQRTAGQWRQGLPHRPRQWFCAALARVGIVPIVTPSLVQLRTELQRQANL